VSLARRKQLGLEQLAAILARVLSTPTYDSIRCSSIEALASSPNNSGGNRGNATVTATTRASVGIAACNPVCDVAPRVKTNICPQPTVVRGTGAGVFESRMHPPFSRIIADISAPAPLCLKNKAAPGRCYYGRIRFAQYIPAPLWCCCRRSTFGPISTSS